MKFKDCVVGMRVKVMMEEPWIGSIIGLDGNHGTVAVEIDLTQCDWYSPHMLRKLKPKKSKRVIWVNEYDNGFRQSSCYENEMSALVYKNRPEYIRTIRFVECPEREEK